MLSSSGAGRTAVLLRTAYIISVLLLAAYINCSPETEHAGPGAVDYTVQLDTVSSGYDGTSCWVHARAGIIPGARRPSVVMTMHKLLLSGSDVFFGNEHDALGKSWRQLGRS